ncbi:interleukin-1 receptor-like 1 [Mauremys reevesii]|uniref:interleukin-1 receptor-like 1 n=1 Tax=Mauremys reevesii TaxID=260615 RepID=UPI00193FBF0A|nr:interleukin-1 receptor-like 1 [Mauremys reevesii]XP_039376404.1 interleukin-1 receptor-like 1 [Mauremys reevesii]XP_039376414.1 interleukin-1 receptor-like 1 [Mauremys reevesii]XP_039376425.1 interleukin-1 receptor-like 1 [Mauremys reevesii]XP_039376432.1 interleukin-1 receptor-like 1 [Mauremys reevesii]
MGLLHLILLSTFLSVSMTSESFHAMEDEALVVKCPQYCQNGTVKWYSTQTTQPHPAEEGGRIHSSGRFLWFLPTSKEDSGNYTCVAQYSNCSKQSTVSVMVYPHKQGICFPSRIRYPNDTGTLTSGRIVCPTIDNYANATIVKWYKDCKPLQGPREKYSMGKKYLFIERPQKTDEGYYTCHFTYIHSGNVYNVSATRPFIVKEEVSSPISPKIQYPTDNTVIQVEFGSPVNISCRAFLGIGKQNIAVVAWEVNEIKAEYLNTSRFREDHKFFMRCDREYYGESILTIEEVTEEDLLSNFTCVALNEIEHVMLTVTLQLKVPCKGDNHSTYTTIGILVLLVIIVLLLILYHFFRTDIVLLCQGIFKPYKTQDDGKIYDAYVIYPKNRTNEANFVEYFVHQILPDVLENKHGYKLCIYGRDMLPGEDAASALEMRIQKSRRLIIILTPQLIQCEEFGYEHQIALYNALIQNNIKVILLEMETIGNYEGLQESLRYIIKQQGTIKWKEKHKECPHASNSKFWKLVRYHMPLRHKPSQLNHAV